MWKVIQAVDHVINAFGRAIGIRHLVRDIAAAIAAAMAAAAHAVYDVVTAVDALLVRIGLASAASGRLADAGAGAAAGAAAAGAPVGGGGRPHHASGGITGGGWTMVGERGRELVRLPAGSSVYSAPDTQRMLGQGGGPVVVHNHIHVGGRGHSTLDQALLTWLRDNVQVLGGGSVQVALGTDY